jgi:hypothetical protein
LKYLATGCRNGPQFCQCSQQQLTT